MKGMNVMAIYRVRVGVLSHKGILLNPIDFVVSANTDDLSVIRKYYSNEKYRGFNVEVSRVEQVEVFTPVLPVQIKTAQVTTQYLHDKVSVTIDEALYADYTEKKKAYENVKDCVRKESITQILAANTHLQEIYKCELLDVSNKTVRVEINAEIKGEFVRNDMIRVVDC